MKKIKQEIAYYDERVKGEVMKRKQQRYYLNTKEVPSLEEGRLPSLDCSCASNASK